MTAYCPHADEHKVGDPAPPPPLVSSDVLSAAPGVKPAAIRWTPGRAVGTGLLCIQNPVGRCCCEYRVTEYPVGWDGRAARFTKAPGQPGSDAEANAYDVFVSRNLQDRRCDCRGFLQHGHCKHTAALLALLQNGWLDLPGADVGPTEQDEQPEPDLPDLPDLPDPDDFLSPGDAAAADEYLTAPRPDLPPIDWTDVPL